MRHDKKGTKNDRRREPKQINGDQNQKIKKTKPSPPNWGVLNSNA